MDYRQNDASKFYLQIQPAFRLPEKLIPFSAKAASLIPTEKPAYKSFSICRGIYFSREYINANKYELTNWYEKSHPASTPF
jgi:hypothetical protein